MKKVTLALAAVAAVSVTHSFGAVKLATPFADGMVLQRGMAVPVWGTADAGEKVKVSFAGASVETVADAKGAWRVDLPEMAASKEPRTLTANDRKISDVLVGEVWFCSGQSNTELPLVGGNPHFSDRVGRLTAQMTHRPYVRYVYASNYKWSPEPKTAAAYPVAWKAFTPENLMASPSFSAMGVYFALELYAALDVPVGIVGSYWGGTNIDAWTPRCGYEGKAELADTASYAVRAQADWKDEFRKGPISGPQQQPTVLWNEMVAPWCPMAMRGFIWYQGCHNSGDGMRYCAKMHALYDGWSKSFENPALKLYFVQLAPFSCSWYNVQLAQAKFAAEEKNAALVTTVDIGNSTDVHPWEKGTIGRRLAALAMKHDYGFDKIVADAPTPVSCTADGSNAVVRCANADGWYVYNPDWSVDIPFELCGADGMWAKASLVNANGGKTVPQQWVTRGEVQGQDLVLRSAAVAKPVKVRYLFQKPWIGNVFSKPSGLPLGPFEMDVAPAGAGR